MKWTTILFFLYKEVEINIEMSVVSLNSEGYEEQILQAVNILPTTGKDQEIYAVVGEGEEDEA